VKTGCLVIELLELTSQRFEPLKVRSNALRDNAEAIVAKYMAKVHGESEMRYLLLEKDIEERDALDLITNYSIFAFLQSQYAENVVKEIWRSPYAMNDTIF